VFPPIPPDAAMSLIERLRRRLLGESVALTHARSAPAPLVGRPRRLVPGSRTLPPGLYLGRVLSRRRGLHPVSRVELFAGRGEGRRWEAVEEVRLTLKSMQLAPNSLVLVSIGKDRCIDGVEDAASFVLSFLNVLDEREQRLAEQAHAMNLWEESLRSQNAALNSTRPALLPD